MSALKLREAVHEEKPHSVIDLTQCNFVEKQHINYFGQQREPGALPAPLRVFGRPAAVNLT
jgi:hypothetical protein